MMADYFSGYGTVIVAKTRERIAEHVRYNLAVSPPTNGRVGHIDAMVDLKAGLARSLIIRNDMLTLILDDNREIDFFVQHVGGQGSISFTTASGIRPSGQQ